MEKSPTCIFCNSPIGMFQDAVRLNRILYHRNCWNKQVFILNLKGQKIPEVEYI